MSDEQAAPGGDTTPAPVTEVTAPADTPNSMGARDAARLLASLRHGKPREADKTADTDGPAETGEAQEAAPQDAPVEADKPADAPDVLAPPKAWTKEAQDKFNALPRDVREHVLKVEETREREIAKIKGETAAEKKAAQAERQRIAQAMQEYQNALPRLHQLMQAQMTGEYADIKTFADVEKMAAEDWPRYVRWDAAQKKVQAIQNEMKLANDRASQETGKRWDEFSQEQDKLFSEKVPDFADPAKAEKLTASALNVLKDAGFTEQELAEMWNGRVGISLRDHRVQMLVLGNVKFAEAQKAAKEAKAKPLPPVQRPGVAQPAGAANTERLKTLSERLSQTGSAKDAAALLTARRAGR